jgi:gamma-glutamyltranspeptidase/glutathione hydrolase
MILSILSGFDLDRSDMSPVERVHVLAEATKLVYRERDMLLGDPSYARISVDELLSEP